LAKKWLFWLCEGSALCVGAKPNVPLAGWLKLLACLVFFLAVLVNASHLFLKNAGGKKIKNTG
jgi:hypothetical protein